MFFLVTQISQITQIFPSSIVYPQMRPIRSDYADFRCSIFLPFKRSHRFHRFTQIFLAADCKSPKPTGKNL